MLHDLNDPIQSTLINLRTFRGVLILINVAISSGIGNMSEDLQNILHVHRLHMCRQRDHTRLQQRHHEVGVVGSILAELPNEVHGRIENLLSVFGALENGGITQ